MKLLITGGAGFIGSNFVKLCLKERPEFKITVLDALTYCGNLDNFPKWVWENERFTFCKGNILDKELVFDLMKKHNAVVHFAAYSHVDRSIDFSDPFIDTDFKGTQVLLEAIRKHPVKRFVHISTSEVYGTAQYIPMDENHLLNPQSPYAAAKAGADRLAYSYWLTYKLPIIIVRPFNTYGPNQYPEKLIPLFITNSMEDKKLPVYGTGENTRDWLYVTDCCEGILKALESEITGEAINLGTGEDYSILQVADAILKEVNKPKSLIELIGDRPGHVKRLVASYEKVKSLLGWEPKVSFQQGIKITVNWYKENKEWWKKLKETQEFKEFEQKWYSHLRLKKSKN